MPLSPEVLLSLETRNQFVANVDILPIFMSKDDKPKAHAAVLIPLCIRDGEVHILYTLRSMNLRKHGGQVSFPGGKMDENETIVDTALRETKEEIGFPRSDVEVWCKMPSFYGLSKEMCITPVVGVLKNFDIQNLQANTAEVDEIFTVSMQTLCNINNHAFLVENNIIGPIFYSGKHNIWGITGFITHLFLQSFLSEDIYNPNFTRKQYSVEELLPSKI